MMRMMRTIIVLVLAMSVVTHAGVDLHGVVKDEKDQPAAGVTVYINGVAPKTGEGFGDGYYADWGKKAATDAEGKFSIADVDPELRFGLLVVGEGRPPVTKTKVDPAKEVNVKLRAM